MLLFIDQDNEEVRILLNPLYITSEMFNSKIRMKINGIPHGNKVIVEVRSSLFQLTNFYELTVMNLSDRLIIKMNIALEWNYFSSVCIKLSFSKKFRLIS